MCTDKEWVIWSIVPFSIIYNFIGRIYLIKYKKLLHNLQFGKSIATPCYLKVTCVTCKELAVFSYGPEPTFAGLQLIGWYCLALYFRIITIILDFTLFLVFAILSDSKNRACGATASEGPDIA